MRPVFARRWPQLCANCTNRQGLVSIQNRHPLPLSLKAHIELGAVTVGVGGMTYFLRLGRNGVSTRHKVSKGRSSSRCRCSSSSARRSISVDRDHETPQRRDSSRATRVPTVKARSVHKSAFVRTLKTSQTCRWVEARSFPSTLSHVRS